MFKFCISAVDLKFASLYVPVLFLVTAKKQKTVPVFLVSFAKTYFSIGLKIHAHSLGKFLPVDEKNGILRD